MPNAYDQRKLLDRLIQDKDAELMPNEINHILETELSKPADEVDVQLVNELLDLLGAEEPGAADMEACWQSIQQERKPRKRFSWKKTVHRVAAVAAMIALVFFVSFESAKAFHWNFLLKLLAPVAETFGIYSTSTFDSEEPAGNHADIINADSEYEQVAYDTIDQMPSELAGYRIVPGWVPERFAFVQGTAYQDPDMTYCTLFYQHNDDYLSVNTYIYHNDEAVIGYEYEKTLSEPRNEEINGILVSFYHNNEDGGLSSASWIDGDAHYHAEGSVTDEELRLIVGSLTA